MTEARSSLSHMPDRSQLSTEQRLAASTSLDQLSVQQTLELINQQDQQVALAVQTAIPQLARLVEAVVHALQNSGRLVYFGAGTSGRLGVLDASECPPTFHCDLEQVVGIIAGGDTALRQSSEGAEDDPHGVAAEFTRLNLGLSDVAVGIAAGATTPYVLGGLDLARARGATTCLLCCVTREQAQRVLAARTPPDHLICLPVGPEVLTGSTRMKAGTATKLALNMITTSAMVQLGKAWGNLMVDLRASNAKLRDRAARIIAGQCQLDLAAALDLLDQADGRVKLALIMGRLHITRDQAQRMLDQHGQKLQPILGPPR